MKKKLVKIMLGLIPLSGWSQVQNVDKVIAVVGKYIILRSEFETQKAQYKQDGARDNDSLKNKVFEELLYSKLLIAQADKDSVSVKDEQVDAELDRRMNYYIGQFGSDEKFEAFYGKKTDEFKEELRDDVKDQLIAQQMQGKVVGDIKLTPAEIRTYYHSIPEDSLPLVNSEVEIGQLLKQPEISAEAKQDARNRLEGLRKRVVSGESMAVMATLYTDDPGSAKSGGKYDGIRRGQFVPEFEAVAFRLKPGEISEIFESPYGFHFIELIAKRGEVVDVRHILASPKITNSDVALAKQKLDSIYVLLQEKKITFCEATKVHSDDKDTKNNCGTMVNNISGSTRFEVNELGQMDQNLLFMLDKMQPGDYTKPTVHQSPDGKTAYRIIYLRSRSEPHRANLKDDYQRIQNYASIHEQKKRVSDWVSKKSKSTYIKIDKEFQNCTFVNNWHIQFQ